MVFVNKEVWKAFLEKRAAVIKKDDKKRKDREESADSNLKKKQQTAREQCIELIGEEFTKKWESLPSELKLFLSGTSTRTYLAKGIMSKTFQWAHLLFPKRKRQLNKTMHPSVKTWIWLHLKRFRNRSPNLTPKLKTKEIHPSSTRNHISKQNKWLKT